MCPVTPGTSPDIICLDMTVPPSETTRLMISELEAFPHAVSSLFDQLTYLIASSILFQGNLCAMLNASSYDIPS